MKQQLKKTERSIPVTGFGIMNIFHGRKKGQQPDALGNTWCNTVMPQQCTLSFLFRLVS